MKIAIAGTRTIFDPDLIEDALKCAHFGTDEIVTGGAKGVDRSGEVVAKKYAIKLTVFPAQWAKYGRAAGPIRNREISQYADCLVAVWNGKSRGTKNMIEAMKKQGKPVYVHEVKRCK